MSAKGKGPLCKVCNDEASGFHYGVDSCEGCKGFFRRCITQGMNHRCSNDEKCEITPFSRNSCQYCRLKKCFSVGMSREASRLGRRPKRLKSEHSANDANNISPRNSTSNRNQAIAPNPATLSPEQISKLSMAELQRLLQSIQEGKVPMPPGLLNLITFDQNQVPVINLSPPADGVSNDVGSNNAVLIGGHPSPGECDSGYTSMKGDTPGSSKSESPVTAALLPQVPPQQLEQKPSPRASVSTQQSIQSQYSVQFSPPSSSPNYPINTPMANHVSPMSDIRLSNDALRNSVEYDYDRKPNIHHFNQNAMNAKRNFAQVDNYQNESSSPLLDNLNCMNEVLSHMKQEEMSPEPCLNGVHPQDTCNTDTKPPQDNVAFIEQNKQVIKQELETQMINLS